MITDIERYCGVNVKIINTNGRHDSISGFARRIFLCIFWPLHFYSIKKLIKKECEQAILKMFILAICAN